MENLDLIDWRMLAFSSLWIFGLALILTVLGFAYYHAQRRKRGLSAELRRYNHQVVINGALVLFCLGMLGSTSPWWERVLWLLLALAFFVYFLDDLRKRKDGGDLP